ncbi:leucine-rich repeat isoform f [Anaeramoeba flamelloides]|uniref:Leucine-rich repeat isoform f n=1 Tax=Anaeramoeba flamelloides TaxID=1746091 RepID=A0AAV7ZFG8_9EUKA|nr:leucine-rich repeat isoform f [Anaeramoeba flamelloides]
MSNKIISQQVCSIVEKQLNSKLCLAIRISQIQKNKKNKERILFLTQYRIVLQSVDRKFKMKKFYLNEHLFNLRSVRSIDESTAKIKFKTNKIKFNCSACDQIIEIILTNYCRITVGFPQEAKLIFNRDPNKVFGGVKTLNFSAKGFFETYSAMCDFLKTKKSITLIDYISQEILDIDDEEKSKKLNLIPYYQMYLANDSQLLLSPLILSLTHNTFFKSFLISNVSNKMIIKTTGTALGMNTKLEKIVISNTGATKGFKVFGKSLSKNKKLPLKYLDLSVHNISEKEVKDGFARGLKHKKKILKELDLSFCQMSPNSITEILQAFNTDEKSIPLEYLNLSRNTFGKKGSKEFKILLKDKNILNSLMMLDLSECSLNIDNICIPIATHLFAKNLCYLNLSGNEITKQNFASLATIIQRTSTLQKLNIAKTNLKPSPLSQIFKEVLTNDRIQGFILDVSSNPIGKVGVELMIGQIPDNNAYCSLEELILDDCNLGASGISHLFSKMGLPLVRSLKRISLSRNVSKGKLSKELSDSLNYIFKSGIYEYIRICGDEKYYIGENFCSSFAGLSKNPNILGLDLYGNKMGLKALKQLFEELTNSKCQLQCIDIGGNNIDLNTLQKSLWMCNTQDSLNYFGWPKRDLKLYMKTVSKKEINSTKEERDTIKTKIEKKIKENQKNNNNNDQKSYFEETCAYTNVEDSVIRRKRKIILQEKKKFLHQENKLFQKTHRKKSIYEVSSSETELNSNENETVIPIVKVPSKLPSLHSDNSAQMKLKKVLSMESENAEDEDDQKIVKIHDFSGLKNTIVMSSMIVKSDDLSFEEDADTEVSENIDFPYSSEDTDTESLSEIDEISKQLSNILLQEVEQFQKIIQEENENEIEKEENVLGDEKHNITKNSVNQNYETQKTNSTVNNDSDSKKELNVNIKKTMSIKEMINKFESNNVIIKKEPVGKVIVNRGIKGGNIQRFGVGGNETGNVNEKIPRQIDNDYEKEIGTK